MKKGSLLILLLILSLVSASASAVETRMASDGSIRFDGKSNRLFYNPVVPLSNGNLLVAVNSSPTGGAYQTWAVCIAPDGEMVWATEISRDGESMFVSSMREMSDGTIHITASLHRYKDRQQMGLAIQNGSILWQNAPIQIISDELASDENVLIQSIPVGKYFLSSETHDCNASGQPVYIQLETHGGEALWRAKDAPIGMSTVVIDQAWQIEQDILLFGRHTDGAILQRMDAHGNIVWRSILPEDVGAQHLLVTQNGEIILFSISSSRGMEQENMRWDQRNIACLSGKTGEVLWVQRHAVDENQFANIQSIMEIPQGYLCVTNRIDRKGLSCFLLDRKGNELTSWIDGRLGPSETMMTADLFFWQDRPWVYAALSTADDFSNAAILPIHLPDEIISVGRDER